MAIWCFNLPFLLLPSEVIQQTIMSIIMRAIVVMFVRKQCPANIAFVLHKIWGMDDRRMFANF